MSTSAGPPARGHGYLVWGLGTAFLGIGLLTAVLLGILAEQVRNRLGVSNDAIGMLSAVFYLAYSLAQFAGGIMLDRLNPRWVLGLSSLIAAAACLLLADASSLGLTVAGRALLGIGLSTSFLGAIYLARVWFPADRFALMSGAAQLATNIGLCVVLIGLSVTGAIPTLRAAMLAMALGYLLLGVAMMLLVGRPAAAGAAESVRPSLGAQLSVVLRTRQFWLGTVCFASVFGVLLAWNDLWGIMNQRAYGRSLEMAAALTSTVTLAAGAGGLLLGWLSDRLDRRSSITALTSWLLTVVMALVLFLPRLSTPGVFVLLFVFGFLLGSNILGFAQIGQHIPENAQATAFGLMTSVGFLAGSALDYLVGAGVGVEPPMGTDAAVAHYRSALIPLLAALAVGAVCAIALRDRPRTPESATVEALPA
jgi:sugar phosphate permease